MRILIVENTESELEKATAAAKKKGWEVIPINPTVEHAVWQWAAWQNEMKYCEVVATDLMWPWTSEEEKPQGLLVVIHAITQRKPVVICTNADEYPGGHHGDAIAFIRDGYVCSVPELAFGWIEDKNWEEAMDVLEKSLNKK